MTIFSVVLGFLLLALPLIFCPWRRGLGTPEQAGLAVWLTPRWMLLTLALPFLVVSYFRLPIPLLDVLLVLLVCGQTARTSSRSGNLRGASWVLGILLPSCVATLAPPVLAFLSAWWWAPWVLVICYTWTQWARPGWDFDWRQGPGHVYQVDPETLGENREQVLSALAFQAPASDFAQAAPVSTMGASHYTAEVLAGVAAAAPWPVAIFVLGTMVMLRSRLALLAAAAALVLFVPSAPWQITPSKLLAAASVCAAATAILVRAIGLTLPTDPVRLDIWRRTWELIRNHPWIGTGTGTFRDRIRQGAPVGERPWFGVVATAHSEYLERAAEWGIPGALLFTAWVAWHAVRRPGCLALALAAVAGHAFYHPAGWFLFCLLAGLP